MSEQDSEAIKKYLQAVSASFKQGNATEHTYRPALEALLEAVGGRGVDAVNEPRQIECGAPDFIVQHDAVPLGYVEAKDVGSDLDRIEKSEQLQRYRGSLGNLVLTDYLEFRWYVNGELRLTAKLPGPDRNGRPRFQADAVAEVARLLRQFLAADIPLNVTPKELATRMAGLAQLIRSLILKTFQAEGDSGELHSQREAFRKVLIESLTREQFADMYAQTLAYGLFAARCNVPAQGFSRQVAATALPKTNPFLRKLFHSIAGPDLDERIAWAVDQLAQVLARADISAILADFGRRTRREDPVVHFYETFLAAYDPKMREARGVYYTPEPVVGYIVRSVDALLKRHFGMPEGLAHAGKVMLKRRAAPSSRGNAKPVKAKPAVEKVQAHRLQILDPATGTGTFLYAVIGKIREHFDGNAGAWPGYVAEHLLPRLFGFELLMAPYAVAHMKLGLELEATGYDFSSDQRLGVYLTNSLEEAHAMGDMPLFTQWLAEEARAASDIKRNAPVMVVLGNPPYSGHSANKGEWIAGLLRGHDSLNQRDTENYFEVGGKPLGERNPKWLNDDYVKFIRFAQWRIEQTGHGVLGFVTNHGYLDNPTFRGMRESLLHGFDEIYLLDLHGNSKKKEHAPDGGKDDNVFDIQQGVAIGVFVRRPGGARDGAELARVFHADLYGPRQHKYDTLAAANVTDTEWAELVPSGPEYYFVPFDAELVAEYDKYWKITDAMPVNSVGIVTARDKLSIHWDVVSIFETVQGFARLPTEEARQRYGVGKDSQDWSVSRAQRDLNDSGPVQVKVSSILYRPFDTRWTYFTGTPGGFHCRPRNEVMRHLLSSNVALLVPKQTKDDWGAFVSSSIVGHKAATVYDITSVFPLWLYPDDLPIDLLDVAASERKPNIAPDFVAASTQAIDTTPTPEDTLAWIYAVLYAPSYRTRYADFLKRDFPRIPLPPNRALFERLVAVGHELIALHTMQTMLPRITTYDVTGTNEVGKVRWAEDTDGNTGRVYINAKQYFGKVPAGVWQMHIGGYRVAEKWLKDRKGRQLSYDDLTHYQAVIAALDRTLALQAGIDVAIDQAGGWPLH